MDRLRCLADINGPFFDSQKPFRNWSAFPFYQVDRSHPPYVDHDQLAMGVERAKAYLKQLHVQGYTGIVIDNLAHLTTFESAPVSLYAPDSPYLQRARAYRVAFREIFDAAISLDMEVFVATDMQWCTPPLRRYVGRLDAANPRLAMVNRWALEELFAVFPQVRGLVMRTGETGGAHDQDRDYTGHMIYAATRQLRTLIEQLLAVCERCDRLLIVRTWSVGIGETGDLLWSPERYREVFGELQSPHLLASVKHTPTDFFRLTPPNPTLGLPGPEQIIEVQNRREYELFGMTPSAITHLHQDVIRQARRTNQCFNGIWAWNSAGGWGGGSAALGVDGWSVWTELNSALTAALMRDADLDTEAFARRWCFKRFGELFGEAVANVYLDSADILTWGWYMGPPARHQTILKTIHIPSLLWVWWMRPTASPLIWAYLAITLEDIEATLERGAEVVNRLAQHVMRLSDLAPSDDSAARAIVESVRYFYDVIQVAAVIRTTMLHLFDAARYGHRTQWNALAVEAAATREHLQRHYATWNNRIDLPPLELEEIDAFLAAFAQAPRLTWYQARASCLIVNRLRRQRRSNFPARAVGSIAVVVLLASLLAQRRRGTRLAGMLISPLLAPPLRQRMLRALLPWFCRRFHLLPSIFFETGPKFTEWMA